MDNIDRVALVFRPVVLVLLPAWLFNDWMGDPALGAIIGFAYMWNFMATKENAELALAFEEIREELATIKRQLADRSDD